MVESAVALAARYGMAIGPLLDHIDDLLHRFGNRALGDTNARVARDPERKLAAGDRLIGAIRSALALELPTRHLSLAVAAGAVRVLAATDWDDSGLSVHLDTNLGDQLEAGQRELLDAQISALKGGFDFATQMDLIEQTFEPSRVI
jgi:mannitol-1-phosphate 5-dehydrogenase